MRLLFALIGLLGFSLSATAAGEWLYYKHYPWVYDNVSKDWLYLRGAAGGEIYAYRSSTKEWEVFEVQELQKTWDEQYAEWILNPESYGGLSVVQTIKEAKDNQATKLAISSYYVSDITPLTGLTNLTELVLESNNVGDILPLAGLTNLTKLNLHRNNISDLTPLAGLTNLTTLFLGRNNISDLTPLAGLTNLEELNLSNTNITDLTPLAGLTKLTWLTLNENNISASQKAMLEEALPNTYITWPDVIIDDSVSAEKPSSTHTAQLNNGVSLEMIWVEPGTFTMGSPTTEAGRSSNETQHEVTLTQGFYLGKYEVTQAQYEAVMTGNTDHWTSPTPSNFAGNPDRPVESVSWDDIQKFLTRLNAQEAGNIPAGWAYVLPTEAQWEYACRAGTTTAYSWGDSITSDNANYSSSGYSQTRDVGLYDANPWGFFDMHGNVREWTADAWGSYATGGVLRGGFWFDTGTNLRSAGRNHYSPNIRDNATGFRVGFQQQ